MVRKNKRINVIKLETSNDHKTLVKEEKYTDTEDLSGSKCNISLKTEVKKESKKKGNDWRYFNKSEKIKLKSEKSERGVVYVSCLPHGFYEKQLEGYFGQFGKVTGVYVPKSKKTGRSKGFAFVEFMYEDVAKIAAETMNNYLMFNRLIKTELLPPEKHRPGMFSDRYKKIKSQRDPSKVTRTLAQKRKVLREGRDSFIKRATSKIANLQASLQHMGVEYKFKVAGMEEGVTLTSHKTIDPENSVKQENTECSIEGRNKQQPKTKKKKASP